MVSLQITGHTHWQLTKVRLNSQLLTFKMPLVSFTHPTLLRLGSLHKVVLSRLYFIFAGVGPLYQSLVISDKTVYDIGVNSVNTVIIINGIGISLDVCKN